MNFYTYAHFKADTNEVFYIGKGRAKPFYCVEADRQFDCGTDALGWLSSIGLENPSIASISAAVNGKRKNAYGYTWLRHSSAIKTSQGSGI